MTDESKGEEGWGPWVEHDGKGLPVPVGTTIWILEELPIKGGYMKTGPVEAVEAPQWDWSNWRKTTIEGPGCIGVMARIVAYRVYKPRGSRIVDELLERLKDDPGWLPGERPKVLEPVGDHTGFPLDLTLALTRQGRS